MSAALRISVGSAAPEQRSNQQAPCEPTALASLSDAQRSVVLGRLAIIDRWQRYAADARRRGIKTTDALDLFFAELAATVPSQLETPSRGTLYRWLAAYERHGLDGLIDRRGRGADGSGDAISTDALAMLRALYLAPQKRSIKLCWEIVAHHAQQQGWSWPSYSTIKRWTAANLPDFQADYHREGPRRWEQKHAPRISRDPSQFRPNEMWIGDHHQLDLVCLHEGAPIRPWLTAWQCRRSRMFVAAVITHAPNSDTIIAAFAQGVRRHGAPLAVTMDNGKDYRATGVAGGKVFKPRVDESYVGGVMGQVGVERVVWATPYNPGAKSIERAFGSVCDRFSKLFETYCGNKPDARPESLYADLRSGNVSVPTLADVAALFAEFLDAHHRHSHTGEGMDGRSPIEVFEQDNPIARRTAPEELLGLLLMKTVRAKVTRSGIRHNSLLYGAHHPEVWKLRDREVLLRIDPLDASYVLVCDLEGRVLCRAENDRIRGLTQDDIRAGMRSKKIARTLAKRALPALKADRADLTTHAMIAAQRRLADAQVEERRLAAGAEGQGPDAIAQGQTPTSRNVAPIRTSITAPAFALPNFQANAPLYDDDDLTLPDSAPILTFGQRLAASPTDTGARLSDDLDDADVKVAGCSSHADDSPSLDAPADGSAAPPAEIDDEDPDNPW
ncbi:MAG: Mu transposase C-terminal domain-containing protein [Phycisphaerae bacterium]|nr:Mu transposase C-terminal domain-containing protein [Phycisphaerae bacterium]